ncbi:MAG: thioredoxin domain-containing protein [Bacteroidetes bacterium]|nr:thioredoxin domain-containing protein [Bacteroidota bacterium]
MTSKKYTNQLIHESSPYLLQHAHNPVNWYAWGNEAWEKAITEDKPVLVSIGYAACHWCHVMEKESFENEETAALMNEHFINIKVDREERPDLDHIFMDALMAMSGQGGWPLNIFLSPSKQPFFGGTYFPPKRLRNRMSWNEVLLAIKDAYIHKRDEIEEQAENLTQHLKKINQLSTSSTSQDNIFQLSNQDEIAKEIMKQADTAQGGFGLAPKFPQTSSIIYLLRQFYFKKDKAYLKQALLSLDKMMQGGIYDHLAGGFSRYSTDEKWQAPHFEKMLYDNALLVMAFTEAYQLTKLKCYEKIITQTCEFLEKEMLAENGGFYSSLDADSEGIEGKFYTWQKKEIVDILDKDASLFCKVYDISENGNWDHANILWLPEPIESIANSLKITTDVLSKKMDTCKEKLLQVRNKKMRPATDTKILTGWNALLISAYCKAAMALQNEAMKQRAIASMNFLENNCKNPRGVWLHAAFSTHPQEAFLDDLAYIIQAYILLQELTGASLYLDKAKTLTEYVMMNFSVEDSPLFYYISQMQQPVLFRKIDVYDGAVPSGNAVMAENLAYLSKIYDRQEWADRNIQMIETIGKNIVLHPLSFGYWALQVQAVIEGVPEIVITGTHANNLKSEVVQHYMPLRIMQSGLSPNDDFPLLKEKIFDKRNAMIYLCRNYSCEKPLKSAEQLFLLLKY